MKKTLIIPILILALGICKVNYAQVWWFPGAYTHITNVDATTQSSLGTLNGNIGTRNKGNLAINRVLNTITGEEKTLIKQKYNKNKKYDETAGFMVKSMTVLASGFGNKVIADKLDTGYYLTKNKRQKIAALGLNEEILVSLLLINKKKITAANRQEIYRLRGEIIRQYSKNDKMVKALLLLPAAAYAVENKTELLKIIKNLEVFL